MTMQDPIAAMLTQIRNGQMGKKAFVTTPASTKKAAILEVLLDEGYILGFEMDVDANDKPVLKIHLKYYQNQPVISRIDRKSSPGLRVYKTRRELSKSKVLGGLGIAILSTSKGVMTDKKARAEGLGGEVLCLVA